MATPQARPQMRPGTPQGGLPSARRGLPPRELSHLSRRAVPQRRQLRLVELMLLIRAGLRLQRSVCQREGRRCQRAGRPAIASSASGRGRGAPAASARRAQLSSARTLRIASCAQPLSDHLPAGPPVVQGTAGSARFRELSVEVLLTSPKGGENSLPHRAVLKSGMTRRPRVARKMLDTHVCCAARPFDVCCVAPTVAELLPGETRWPLLRSVHRACIYARGRASTRAHEGRRTFLPTVCTSISSLPRGPKRPSSGPRAPAPTVET